MNARKSKIRSTKRSPLKRLFYLAVTLLGIWLLFQLFFSPNGSEYLTLAPKSSAMMELRREELTRPIQYRFVALEKISPAFRLAVLVAEDIDFPTHQGFAINEMLNSIVDALTKVRMPRGASTISQQLAKNLYLSPSKNPLRKIKEAIITYKLENNLSKRRIFELYLNIVELGPGIFGVEAASQHWFSKPASALSNSEAAKLAAILPGPNSAFNPTRHAKKVTLRQQSLLRRMLKSQLPKGL
jgi:monofunctional biosynthetic peptidoglycan transglycosylase